MHIHIQGHIRILGQFWTGTSLQLKWGVFSDSNDIYLFFIMFRLA